MNGNLTVKIGNMNLKNPIIPASGTFGFGKEYEDFLDINALGAFVTKGLTLKGKYGNNLPRIAETQGGMLNSIGLENPGVERFVEEIYPTIKHYDTCIIANISGNTIEEYGQIASLLKGTVDGIEINVSCPNVKMGGMHFGTDAKQVSEITSLVKKAFGETVILKLSPIADVRAIAEAAEKSGADAISMINTFPGLRIDTKNHRPILGNNFGGVSGPILKPMALKMVWEVYNQISIPIIGMGGIGELEDVLEFMIAGATAVSIGTMNLVQPDICQKIIAELEHYALQKELKHINQLTGTLILNS